jgi:ubiquinone biosynthesis protein UbiJ
MPELSRFFGIVIRLHYADHDPPHFHASYQGETVEVDIRTLAVLHGRVSARALGLVMEWAAEHQDELADDWRRASSGEPIVRIAPLS